MHEVFEHTADLGLRVVAPDLNTLFAEAGQGLFAMIIENLAEVNAVEQLELSVEGEDKVYLLFDWLNELLYKFESTHLLLSQFDVQVDERGVKAIARGERLDSSRHVIDHEVKAITYHALKLEETPTGWLAEVIVDI
jgi:SHS2 domain-containing protein